jgi:phospholipase/carboxylesterase
MTTPTSTDFAHVYHAGDPDKVTLLLLHGTGGDEHDLVPLGERVLPGASILSPRGQVDEHGHARFFRRLAEGVFDVDDLVHRADALAQWTRAQIAAHGASSRVVAVGFSNGANIASALMLQHPTLLTGAALIRPMVPYVPTTLPDLSGARVLISAGRIDPIVPTTQVDHLESMLQAASADVTLAWQQAGHGLTPADVTLLRDWLARF